MPTHYQYKGKHYQLPDGLTNEQALAKIKAHLGETPAPAAPEPQMSGAQRVAGALMDVAKGAVKEAPLVLGRAAMLPRDITRGALQLGADVTGLSQNPAVAQALSGEEEYAWRRRKAAPLEQQADASFAEKVGRFGARAAPQTALAAMTGGASIPAQAAIQGGGQAAQTAAEGGSAGEVALSGALGTVTGAAAPALSGAVRQLAPRVINSLIKPLEKAFRFGKDPGRGIVNEGITALSRSGLAKQLTGKLDELGGLIERSLTRSGVRSKIIDVAPAIGKIDEAIAAAGSRGEKLLLQRLKDLKEALTKNLDIETGEFVGSKPMRLSPVEVHRLKRQIGEAAKWTGQAFDNEVNQARVAVYRALNDLVEHAAPGTKALQARFADILTAKSSLERTMNVSSRQALGSLPDIVIATGGGIGTVLANPMAAAVAGGAIAGRRLLGSTAGKTSAAWLMNQFPNAAPALQALVRSYPNLFEPAEEGRK